MTDDAMIADLASASPTFGVEVRGAGTSAAAESATLTDALLDLTAHLLRLISRDKRQELAPLLTALERCYSVGSGSQKQLLRDLVLQPLHEVCERGGLAPELFLAHLGPHCHDEWAKLSGTRFDSPVA